MNLFDRVTNWILSGFAIGGAFYLTVWVARTWQTRLATMAIGIAMALYQWQTRK